MRKSCFSARHFPLPLPALVVFAAAGLSAQSGIGITWQELPANPAVAPGNCLSWRCAGTTDPSLLLNTDGSVSVWFTTIGIRVESGSFVADGPYFGRASGMPGGQISFSPEGSIFPVGPDGAWDKYLETPSVRRNPDGTLTMWYMGHPSFGISNTAIGQIVSTDGLGTKWIRPAFPIYRPSPGAWDSGFITGPSATQGPNGRWYLYYSGAGPTGVEGVGLLISSDGFNWEPYRDGPVLPSQPGAWDGEILEECVVYCKGRFWMWYSAYRGPLTSTTPISIGLATSPDGISWTRYQKNPVIHPGTPGSWDDLRVLAPDVVIEPDGSLLMAAYGMSRTDATAGSIGFWYSRP